jgi:RNA polymerase sigma-32 factor
MSRPVSASSTLDQYLREINRVALLTVEEERRLARQFRDQGDKRAGHRLVEANLRFVVKVAFEYRSYGLRMADLIQEGNIGLMKAVQKFDPDKEIRLISYAVWWIRAYIQNHILKSWSLVKIGTTQAQRKLFFSLARTRHEIERLTPGASLSDAAVDVNLVAKKLRVRPSDVVEMTQRMEGRDLSLDAPVADGTSTHLEFTPSEGEGQDEEYARAQEEALLYRRVAEAMGRLDPRERHIIEARIMGEGKETLRDLGHHFGFSRERARQLEIRALEKLRRELHPIADEIGWPVNLAGAEGGEGA